MHTEVESRGIGGLNLKAPPHTAALTLSFSLDESRGRPPPRAVLGGRSSFCRLLSSLSFLSRSLNLSPCLSLNLSPCLSVLSRSLNLSPCLSFRSRSLERPPCFGRPPELGLSWGVARKGRGKKHQINSLFFFFARPLMTHMHSP